MALSSRLVKNLLQVDPVADNPGKIIGYRSPEFNIFHFYLVFDKPDGTVQDFLRFYLSEYGIFCTGKIEQILDNFRGTLSLTLDIGEHLLTILIHLLTVLFGKALCRQHDIVDRIVQFIGRFRL